jgi:hypothetical protein
MSIDCEIDRKKNIRGAPERGGGDRGEEEARGSLARSESTGDFCRCSELRRKIPTAWRRIRSGNRGRKERRSGASYRLAAGKKRQGFKA